MTLMKWGPFETLTELQEDIGRLFDRRLASQGSQTLIQGDWAPAVDIHEDKESYCFDVEAPGMSEDQFSVNVEDNVLIIKGERKREEEKSGKNYYRVEREYGSFLRSFRLPETADTSKVDAHYKKGILQVKIAKKEAAKPKQIPVKVTA